MRRNELKVGETYACHMRPTTARSRWRSYDKPFKATLVATSGTLTRDPQIMVKKDGSTYEAARVESGIIVKLAEPITRKRDKYEGSLRWGSYDRKAERLFEKNEEIVEAVEEIALENAGCFVSTWADYEARQAEEARRERKHKKEREERIEREKAAAPEVEAQIARTRALLVEHVGQESSWGEDWKEAQDEYEYVTVRDDDDVDRAKLKLRWSRDSKAYTGGTVVLDMDVFLALIGEKVTT